jgi:hypothetical protein
MNKLEKIIIEKRAELDSFEPADGHFARFRQKLPRSSAYREIRVVDYLKIAAIVLLASLFSYFLYNQIESYVLNDEQYTLSDVSNEYREVEEYYTGLIQARYEDLKQVKTGDPDQKELLLKELSEMDRLMKQMQEDLKTNPTDERIINAMISHYQKKLEIMNQILSQLESINYNNQYINHEKKDI